MRSTSHPLPRKTSSGGSPTSSSSVRRRIRAPAALHVLTRPSSSKVITPFDMLSSIGVVVPHRLDVREELGVLQCARDLCRKRSQPALVLRCEGASTFVEGLRDTDRPAGLVEDGHAEDAPRDVAALPV